MLRQPKNSDLAFHGYTNRARNLNEINRVSKYFSEPDLMIFFETMDVFKNFFQHHHQSDMNELLSTLASMSGKKSFLVFKHNKYFTVNTKDIAFFYLKYGSSVIICFDGQEYSVNYSLEQIQSMLIDKEFFRLNRQCLINFSAVKEVERYYARKLIVKPVIPAPDKLLISKEKSNIFLHWLENR